MPHCQALLSDLRQKGFRLTAQREMIVQAIAHSDQHLTAEAIFAEVQTRTQTINLATVYRTLELLVDQGFITRVDLGEGKTVYATEQHGPHIHLVCRGCGNVVDADPALLRAIETQLQTEYEFTPDLNHISIFGVCAGCK